MKKRRKKGTVLMTLGVLLLLGAFALTLYNHWDDQRAGSAAQEALEKLHAAIEQETEERIVDSEMPTEIIDGKAYLGELSIPSLELTLPVLAEWEFADLDIAPCRYTGSYLDNDLVIAGHNYRRHFNSLRWIAPGAEVNLTAVDGTVHAYIVSHVEQLKANQGYQMTTPSEQWDMTLFTCTIGGRARYAVRCVRAERVVK